MKMMYLNEDPLIKKACKVECLFCKHIILYKLKRVVQLDTNRKHGGGNCSLVDTLPQRPAKQISYRQNNTLKVPGWHSLHFREGGDCVKRCGGGGEAHGQYFGIELLGGYLGCAP